MNEDEVHSLVKHPGHALARAESRNGGVLAAMVGESLAAARRVLPEIHADKGEEAVAATNELALAEIVKQIAGCQKCVLCQQRTNTVPGQGNPRPDIMFVGEGPGEDEDRQGLAFVGRAGQLLTRWIQYMGLTRDQVFMTNIVKCRPPGNRLPLPNEREACLPYLREQIAILKPRVIICLGSYAVKGLLNNQASIVELRGHWQKYEDVDVMPTYHPSYLLRCGDDKTRWYETREDFIAVLEKLGRAPPSKKYTAPDQTSKESESTETYFDKGVNYYYGRGVPQDYATAVEWYRKAAERGHANAQWSLGSCYEDGKGVPKDYVEAVRWFRKAIEQGHALAQFSLGICYQNGHGVLQDFKEAANWFRKVAEKGYAKAQNNLGACYVNGDGVPQDFDEAVKWYQKAAEQGHATAQSNLGACYLNGQGVPQDRTQAYKWFFLATIQGNANAAKRLKSLIVRMSPAEIDAGEAMAREFVSKTTRENAG